MPLPFRSHRMYSSQRAGSEEAALECSASTPTLPESPLPGVDLRSLTNPSAPPEHLVNFVRCLEPFLPRGCELFGHDDLKVVGPHPIGGGGFSEAWVCERRDGMVVVIKSYRYYSSSSRLPVFLVRTSVFIIAASFLYDDHRQRLYREALLCGHLNGANDVNFVPFLGIYSSRDHPFALVFKFMSYGSLNEYSRNNQEIGRVKLVRSHPMPPILHHLNVLMSAVANCQRTRGHAPPGYHPRKHQDCTSPLTFPFCPRVQIAQGKHTRRWRW